MRAAAEYGVQVIALKCSKKQLSRQLLQFNPRENGTHHHTVPSTRALVNPLYSIPCYSSAVLRKARVEALERAPSCGPQGWMAQVGVGDAEVRSVHPGLGIRGLSQGIAVLSSDGSMLTISSMLAQIAPLSCPASIVAR
jgi:hypothetical protein